MKHLLSTLLLSCTFITAIAMDKNNGNPSSMNVIEADSLRTELPSVKEDDFKAYKEAFPEIDPERRSLPEFGIYKQYLLDLSGLKEDEISNQEFKLFNNYWNDIHKGNQNHLLNEYINYALYKNRAAGEEGKTVSQAFEEYKKENQNSSVTSIGIYRNFLIDICSLSQTDIANIKPSILINSFQSLKNDSNSAPLPSSKNSLEQDKKEEPQVLNQLAPNLSFQDYCKKVLETDTDSWDIYKQYLMHKTNRNLEQLPPDDRMNFLNEYMEYILHKKALATGGKELTISEAFKEYKLNNYGLPFDIYRDFVKKICSISDEDLKFVGASILNGYEVIYKEEKEKTIPNKKASDQMPNTAQKRKLAPDADTTTAKKTRPDLEFSNKEKPQNLDAFEKKVDAAIDRLINNTNKGDKVSIEFVLIDKSGVPTKHLFRFLGEK